MNGPMSTSDRDQVDPNTAPAGRMGAVGRWQYQLAALAAFAIPFLVTAIAWRRLTFSESGRVPLGYDAFFHAFRAKQYASGQWPAFETSIHAPEGSWVVWPWAWDAVLGLAVAASQFLGLHPMELAFAIPVLMGLVNLALFFAIALSLGIDRPIAAVAALALGVAPSFIHHHGYGAIDHHGVETSFWLLAMLFGLRMSQRPEQRGWAFALGATLGAAHAVHPGLFLLHVPVALAFGWNWLRATLPPRHVVDALVAGLLLSALAALLPAPSLWAGLFQFDVPSFFHLWVSLATAAALVGLSRIPARSTWSFVLIPLLLMAAWPLALEVRAGLAFVRGELEFYEHLAETWSLWAFVQRSGVSSLSNYLGPLLLPLATLSLLALPWQRAARSSVDMQTALFFGLAIALGLSQVRYAYLLVPALYLLLALVINSTASASPRSRITSLGLLLACGLSAAPSSWKQTAAAGDLLYSDTQAFWSHLRVPCAEHPILLAEPVFGHFINYFSACRTVASNFISNAHHEAKIRQAYEWLNMPPATFVRDVGEVDLIVVRIGAIGWDSVLGCSAPSLNARLICDAQVPGFTRLLELGGYTEDGTHMRLLALYRVDRSLPQPIENAAPRELRELEPMSAQ